MTKTQYEVLVEHHEALQRHGKDIENQKWIVKEIGENQGRTRKEILRQNERTLKIGKSLKEVKDVQSYYVEQINDNLERINKKHLETSNRIEVNKNNIEDLKEKVDKNTLHLFVVYGIILLYGVSTIVF